MHARTLQFDAAKNSLAAAPPHNTWVYLTHVQQAYSVMNE